MDEAVPFKATARLCPGLVRNRLQYERLYDANGNFRPEVGKRPSLKSPVRHQEPSLKIN